MFKINVPYIPTNSHGVHLAVNAKGTFLYCHTLFNYDVEVWHSDLSHCGHTLDPLWTYCTHCVQNVDPLWTHCGHTVDTLLTHCGHNVDTLWAHCGHTVYSLRHTVDTLWTHCGPTVDPLYTHWGNTVDSLWTHCEEDDPWWSCSKFVVHHTSNTV